MKAKICLYRSPFYWPGDVGIEEEVVYCKRSKIPPLSFWVGILLFVCGIMVTVGISKGFTNVPILRSLEILFICYGLGYLIHILPATVKIDLVNIDISKFKISIDQNGIFGSYVTIKFESEKDFNEFCQKAKEISVKRINKWGEKKYGKTNK